VTTRRLEQRLSDKCLSLLPERLRTAQSWTLLFLLLGLALRVWGYVRNPSLWHDEAALVLNVIGKDFADLLGPLYFSEAAPPLFLWAERAAVLLLGDNTYALRLIPFLAGCGALLLFLPLARRLLPAAAVPWAVLLFALNDHLLWHATEAKPYSVDILAATALPVLWLGTRRWSLPRQLLLFAAVAPLVILLVYPGCFLLGGLMLALLPALWRERARFAAWLAYAVLGLSVAAAFLLLYLGPARAQRDHQIESCWVAGFPPWGGAWWAIPTWVAKTTLDALCYCCAPAGNVLVVVLIAGAVSLWRRGERSAVVLLLAPLGLALLASFLGGYPYFGSRVLAYLTPAVVLLIAAGVPPALAWLAARSRLAAAGLIGLLLAAAGTVSYNTAFPYGRPDIAAAARYVLAERRPGDIVRGNAWEESYYFRHLGAKFFQERLASAGPFDREWLVVIAATSQDREGTLRSLVPDGWEQVQRREFYRTTVVLVQAPGATAQAGRGTERTQE
jgi:hypothetical protein